MITSQIIQTSIDDLRSITKIDFCVFDIEGLTVASTFEPSEISGDFIRSFISSPADSQVIGSHHLLKVYDSGELTYILVARGMSEDVYMVGKIAVSQIQALIQAYKERFDRNNFFQNLILDNMLLVDIYNRAKKLHIDVNVPRMVFLIEDMVERDHDSTAMEVLKGMFTEQAGDYITSVDEKNIILIKDIAEYSSPEEINELAASIVDVMNTEAMVNVRVSYGAKVDELASVSKSYKEAKLALEVGRIFYAEKVVISYSELGIGRLIYQLPENLCKIFIDEIFKDGEGFDIDEETLTTVNKFFENNLNVSETSRQLFVHRNTLVYRLERLQKATGLDVRTFDDALTFKIALMVASYIKYLEKND